jgi:hypothetical protein
MAALTIPAAQRQRIASVAEPMIQVNTARPNNRAESAIPAGQYRNGKGSWSWPN